MEKSLVQIKNEVGLELADQETAQALLATTFNGFSLPLMKQAVMEGMMRGFQFKDFLEKNVYAVKFGSGYNLVTSIDYARKIGVRSGVVGKSEPKFTEDKDGRVLTCTVTVKKKTGDTIGEFTETVYFNEYNTNQNVWKTKPRTMIAKVAEMHALHMACPEELAQVYIPEELEKEQEVSKIDVSSYKRKLEATTNLDELKTVWSAIPVEAKTELEELKNELKKRYENS